MNLDTIKEFGNLELLARQMVEGFITGLHKSPYHGFSVEFAEHNLYNNGESTRYIDWKVYARTDRLYTKRFEEETNLRCLLLIDNSSSMYYPVDTQEKIRFSIASAASLAYILQKQRDAVGLCTFSDKVEMLTQVKSTGKHIHNLFLMLQQMLQNTPDQQKTSVADVIHEVANRIHKRSLVVIFSDMMENINNHDEIFSALKHLKHNNHEVLIFHVYDQSTELDFDFPERPIVFEDLETGQKEKVQPSQVREAYQRSIKERFKEIKLKCGQYKIDFIEADSKKDVGQILLPYLIKRKKMR
ncbi:DUF58 domain-containing protein [Flammeovirgaceae bacterium SG7u.111]|nr:DUF58 domain-containing protein [Flammeovirgaceae bacterium SG7u.132]WPO38463.1 DUF58 domain-containing protein [Flammeovirgaceae bacterium SG7u.111]